MNIYAYSCLKLLSNRPEAIIKQQNPSNHEINVPFEHDILAKYPHCRPHFLYGRDCLTLLSRAKHL